MSMVVETKSFGANGLVLIDPEGGIWYTFVCPWWDISSWFWWWLTPGTKHWIRLNTVTGLMRVRAIRIAGEYVRIGSVPKVKVKRKP